MLVKKVLSTEYLNVCQNFLLLGETHSPIFLLVTYFSHSIHVLLTSTTATVRSVRRISFPVSWRIPFSSNVTIYSLIYPIQVVYTSLTSWATPSCNPCRNDRLLLLFIMPFSHKLSLIPFLHMIYYVRDIYSSCALIQLLRSLAIKINRIKYALPVTDQFVG